MGLMRYYKVKKHEHFLKGDPSSDQGGSNKVLPLNEPYQITM